MGIWDLDLDRSCCLYVADETANQLCQGTEERISASNCSYDASKGHLPEFLTSNIPANLTLLSSRHQS